MTSSQLIRILLRRWYIVLACAVLTVLAVNLTGTVRGVYWNEVDVVFLPGNSSNALEYQTDGLVHFAAVIEREFNGVSDTAGASSSSATLYAAGVRRGYRVILPNAGGQWRTNFNRPVLAVEVVDSSPERVRQVREEVLGRIDELVRSRQEGLGIAPGNFIVALRSPQEPVVGFIAGNLPRARIALGICGVGAAVAASVLVDRLLAKRRIGALRRRSPARSEA